MELRLNPIAPRNNGAFNKGNIPFNKGKKWSEWMDGRKQKRVKKNLEKGRGLSYQAIAGMNRRKIICVLDKKIFGIFESAYDAERKTAINNKNISAVCHKKRKKAGGFRWFFEEDNDLFNYINL